MSVVKGKLMSFSRTRLMETSQVSRTQGIIQSFSRLLSCTNRANEAAET